jgi:hypothetical protein
MSNVAVRRSVTVPAAPEQVRVARALVSEVLGESDAHIDVALLLASTAASCRSTSSSASLDAEDRPGRASRPQRRMKIRCRRRTDINGYHVLPLMLAFAAVPRARGLPASRTPAEGH